MKSLWRAHPLARLWVAGLLLEGALLLVMFTVLVRPEPPLVDRLRGGRPASAQITFARLEVAPPEAEVPPAEEDSFYTVVHWPLTRPLLAGGGHVVALPMRLWWVPALYVGTVPLLLLGATARHLASRRRA